MRYEVLSKALSLKRSHGSRSDMEFAHWLVQYVALEFNGKLPLIDGSGNLIYECGGTTLFAAHIDTAHRKDDGPNAYWMCNPHPTEKEVYIDAESMATADYITADGDCLGADDAVGIMVLIELMLSGKPGAYVFTRGEECGGIGAKFLKENSAPWLATYKRAICFDRRNTGEVITHQGSMRCASDMFGEALADALNAGDDSLLYAPSTKGVYTDCKEFRKLIPECVNVGSGYWNEHGRNEYMDMNHLRALVNAVKSIDFETLAGNRDLAAEAAAERASASQYTGYGYGRGQRYGGFHGLYDPTTDAGVIGWSEPTETTGFGGTLVDAEDDDDLTFPDALVAITLHGQDDQMEACMYLHALEKGLLNPRFEMSRITLKHLEDAGKVDSWKAEEDLFNVVYVGERELQA